MLYVTVLYSVTGSPRFDEGSIAGDAPVTVDVLLSGHGETWTDGRTPLHLAAEAVDTT